MAAVAPCCFFAYWRGEHLLQIALAALHDVESAAAHDGPALKEVA
jgi:hypothetical protein